MSATLASIVAPKFENSVNGAAVTAPCAMCASRHICWGNRAFSEAGIDLGVEFAKRKVKRGATLFGSGETFNSLYAVRSGMFKSSVVWESGQEQVTGFKMPGDMLGLDGIGVDKYASDAVAIEDSEVCVIPYERITTLARENRSLSYSLSRLLSHEIVREQSLMAVLGTMKADERVIAFLLELAARFKARGYAGNAFTLRMTREEIGSYLGLKLETVSRAFTRLQNLKLISLQSTHGVQLLNTGSMRERVGVDIVVQPQRECRAVSRHMNTSFAVGAA